MKMTAKEKAEEIIAIYPPYCSKVFNRLNSIRCAKETVEQIIKAVSKYEYGYWEFVLKEIELIYQQEKDRYSL